MSKQKTSRPVRDARLLRKPVHAAGTRKPRKLAASPRIPRRPPSASTVLVLGWDDDPGAPGGDVRTPAPRPRPDLGGTLAIAIKGKAPAPSQYAQKTPQFRFWAAADALARGAQLWSRILPAGTRWFTGASLPVTIDSGEDLNAYYDRRGLSFFHREVGGHLLFSGESPDVLCHELGHAVLDAIRPELWDTATAEAAAFHEAFGDISALLSNLQLESVRRSVLAEGGGRLYHSSRLSRLAEQLGWGIRQIAPDAVEPDCLRNAVNAFFYRDPSTLPPMAPAGSLSSESHSFSRVFTGAFFEGLAGMLSRKPDPQELLDAAGEAGAMLVSAVLSSPIVPDYYSQIAAHLIRAAKRDQARQAFRAAFVRHGILSLEGAIAMDGGSLPPAARRAVRDRPEGRRTAGAAMVAEAETAMSLTVRHLTVAGARYGLDRPIRIQAPADAKRYSVGSAAFEGGSVQAPSVETAVTAYLEDLFRRGRVDAGSTSGARNMVQHPLTRRTHQLKEVDSTLTLERTCFDCGFDHSI